MKKTGILTLNTILISIILLPVMCQYLQAQTVGSQYRIETLQGNVFTGEVISQNEESIVLSTQDLGEITIARANIRSMREIDPSQFRDGEYWYENPQPTRYFFATNARGIRRGQGYYQNTWIFFNNVNVGLTKNFSLGAGIVPMFLFGASATPIWILPKLSIPLGQDNIHLAAGGLFGGILGEDGTGLGFAYGVATIGGSDHNLSLGLGFGYAGGDWSNTPFVNVSGMTRLGRTTYLLSENYFFSAGDENLALLSIGIRFATERLAVDFGLFRPTDIEGSFIGIPWLGITIPFGK